MGYGTDGLTFNTLRQGNLKRLPLFKNAKGKLAHLDNKWTPAQWLQAVVGELGEYANLRKKVERGDFDVAELVGVKTEMANELADVVIYLDLLAAELEINLGAAVMGKWNEKSTALGIPLYIDAEDWHYHYCMFLIHDARYGDRPCTELRGHAGKCLNTPGRVSK